ncbi:MAG: TIGR02391 family protein [Rhodothermales bacterium]
MYNLTDKQKDLLRWLVEHVKDEEFYVHWSEGKVAKMFGVNTEDPPEITKGALDVFAGSKLIQADLASGRYTLLGKAYEAVDSGFSAPDTSFVRHLTPLADVTNLDSEIKQRCLPILGAGSEDPTLWDSATRTVGVILEERLREVGGISDSKRVGRDLVNDVLGNKGTLASKFTIDSERIGYRDLYAGIVGAFRNPSAHRVIDPSPEEGGAFIVFVNLLLKRLEDLR